MGHFGFSYIGLSFLLLLFIPNFVWTKCQPAGYDASNENKILLIFERVGEVCVTCAALLFSDFNIHSLSVWTLWLGGAALLMLCYEWWWLRYFRSPRTLTDFYSSLFGIPVAGATLPVLAFLLLGIYGKVIWMILAVLVLGIGHIGIHLQHRKEMASTDSET